MVPDVPPADLMSDRRKHLRRLAVKELIGLHLGAGNRGIVVDLSESGMRVQAASRVQLLPATLVRFQIPGCSTPVAASCEVAWADDFGKAGLRFTGFSGNSLHDLRRWLSTTTAPVLVEKREEIRTQTRPLPLPIPKPQVVTASASPRPAPLRVALPVTVDDAEARPTSSQAPAGRAAEPGNMETFAARLHAMTQNLLTLTAAEGAIVALREGARMVCRGSVGTAPPVGTPMQQDSGLAGECVRTGRVVWCPDTNDDSRVNREACQRLAVRSTVLTPVLREGVVCGVLGVFSSQPQVFDRGDVMAMTRLADILAGLLEKQAAATAKVEGAPAGGSATQPSPAAAVEQEEARPAPAPAPRPTLEAALRLPRPENGILRCDACGHPNPEHAGVCESCDVPLRVPELEALLEKGPKISKLLLAAFVVLAPLGCFYAGHETGMLMKRPAMQKSQPAPAEAARPELAFQSRTGESRLKPHDLSKLRSEP